MKIDEFIEKYNDEIIKSVMIPEQIMKEIYENMDNANPYFLKLSHSALKFWIKDK